MKVDVWVCFFFELSCILIERYYQGTNTLTHETPNIDIISNHSQSIYWSKKKPSKLIKT